MVICDFFLLLFIHVYMKKNIIVFYCKKKKKTITVTIITIEKNAREAEKYSKVNTQNPTHYNNNNLGGNLMQIISQC